MYDFRFLRLLKLEAEVGPVLEKGAHSSALDHVIAMATLNATRWPLPQRHSFSLVPFRELTPGNPLGQHRYMPTTMAPLSRKAFARPHGKVPGTATTTGMTDASATHTQHTVPQRTSSTRTIPVENVCYLVVLIYIGC